jgi:hypothetical protein
LAAVADGPNPYNLMEFVRRTPPGAVLTIESIMRNVLPLNTMAIAMGLHVRCGIEDNLWGRKGERMTSVQQVEQMVRIARELHRDVATGAQAKAIYRIGEHYAQRRRDAGAPGLWRPTGLPACAARRCAWPPEPGLQVSNFHFLNTEETPMNFTRRVLSRRPPGGRRRPGRNRCRPGADSRTSP